MANTYSQMYVQIIFSVKGRDNLIKEDIWKDLEKYICGIIYNNSCKPLAIFCNPDHTHILIGLHPIISVAKITANIKANSSKWLNNKNYFNGNFKWQDGYGAFTYSKSQISSVIKYINNQPNHHKKTSFRNEYLSILQKLDIKYNDDYLFEWYDWFWKYVMVYIQRNIILFKDFLIYIIFKT